MKGKPMSRSLEPSADNQAPVVLKEFAVRPERPNSRPSSEAFAPEKVTTLLSNDFVDAANSV